jgi:polyhydroxyalkanoate synthesis repressor PhaR
MPTIKRYNNRKLYDTSSKRYVNLDDIAEMVRAGEEVTVIDHNSADDITVLILFQTLFEEEKRVGGLIPQIFLTRLIRSGSDALGQIKKKLSRSAQSAVSAAEIDLEIERRIQKLVLSGSLSPDEGDLLIGLLAEPQVSGSEAEIEAPDAEETIETGSLTNQLLDQLERLEAELEEIRNQRSHK